MFITFTTAYCSVSCTSSTLLKGDFTDVAVETRIQITRGEDSAIIATNDGGKEKHLRHLGFEVAEEEDGVRYYEIPVGFVQIRRPKQTVEKTPAEKAAIRARLVAGKAAKNAPVAPAPKASSRNGKAATPAPAPEPVAPSPKASVAARSRGKAAAPVVEEVDETPTPAPAKSGGLASRVKISR